MKIECIENYGSFFHVCSERKLAIFIKSALIVVGKLELSCNLKISLFHILRVVFVPPSQVLYICTKNVKCDKNVIF